MRLIDADAIKYNYFMCPETNDPAKMAVSKDKIDAMPTVQQERKIGKWILYDKRFPWRFYYKCSECGNYLNFSGVRGEANYCPNCGAKMKGELDEQ